MNQIVKNVLVLISVSLLTLTGCSTNTQSENTAVGAVTGGVLGGVAGSAIGAGTGTAVAIGVGAVAGALVGGWIGHSMDHSDYRSCSGCLSSNPAGHSSSWKNKNTGARYTMKPTSNVMAYQGHDTCRKYEITGVAGGKKETQSGVACKNADGTWSAVS